MNKPRTDDWAFENGKERLCVPLGHAGVVTFVDAAVIHHGEFARLNEVPNETQNG